MKTVKDLIARLDANDTAEITEESLFAITNTHQFDPPYEKAPRTYAETADGDTDPGFTLLADFLWENYLRSPPPPNSAAFDVAASRHVKLVALLESLKVSTRYDSPDYSLGVVSASPRPASLKALMFDASLFDDAFCANALNFAKATKLYSDEEIAEYA